MNRLLSLFSAALASASMLLAGCELVDMSKDSSDETYNTTDQGTTIVQDGQGNVVAVITNAPQAAAGGSN